MAKKKKRKNSERSTLSPAGNTHRICKQDKDMAAVNNIHDNTVSSAFAEANQTLYGYNYPNTPYTPLTPYQPQCPHQTSANPPPPFTLPPPKKIRKNFGKR